MANVWAIKNGNWSDTTLWNTGSLPSVIDDVYSNNFTVYVDISPQVLSVRNLSATSITRGGSFILNNGISLSANVIGGGVDNVFCVRFLSAAPAFANITGNISTSGSLVSVRQSYALELSGTGTLTVYGSAIGGVNNGSGTGVNDGYIQVNAPGTLNIFGDVRGSLNGNVYYGINNKASGTVNVFGNVTGRTIAGGGVSLHVIRNSSTGTINVTGNIQAGIDNTNIGIFNNVTGEINVRGNVFNGSGSDSYGISNSTGTVNITGNIIGNSGGINAYVVNNNSIGSVNVLGNIYKTFSNNVPALYNTGTVIMSGSLGLSSQGFMLENFTANSIAYIYGNIETPDLNTSIENVTYNRNAGRMYIFGNVGGNRAESGNSTTLINSGSAWVYGNLYTAVGRYSRTIDNSFATSYLFVSGNVYGNSGTTTNYGTITNIGTCDVVGNVYGGNAGNSTGGGIYNSRTLSVTGNVYGGHSTRGIGNFSPGVTTVVGTAYGGPGSGVAGIINADTGIVRLKRATGNEWGLGYLPPVTNPAPGLIVYRSTLPTSGPSPGINGAQNSQTFVEELECGPRGQWPTAGNIYFTPNTRATSMFETDTFQNYSLIQSNSADSLLPPVSSVRQGTTYNIGLSTGTCIIPPVSSVAAGTLVDNLTGTAVLTPQTTWNYPTTASDVNSMGGRLRNALNTNSANSLIDSFNP